MTIIDIIVQIKEKYKMPSVSIVTFIYDTIIHNTIDLQLVFFDVLGGPQISFIFIGNFHRQLISVLFT